MITQQPINLADMPRPELFDTPPIDVLLAKYKTELGTRYPPVVRSLNLESEPAVKQLEVGAYRELNILDHANQSALQLYIATATDIHLDHIGAGLFMARKLINPALFEQEPENPLAFESDDEYRQRLVLWPYMLNANGPRGSYVVHTLNTHDDILSVDSISPAPTEITVSVHTRNAAQGTDEHNQILELVREKLATPGLLPQGDKITVISANLVQYQVEAVLRIGRGPDGSGVKALAENAIEQYASDQERHGYEASLVGISAALQQPGVVGASLVSPTIDASGAPPENGLSSVPVMTGRTITIEE